MKSVVLAIASFAVLIVVGGWFMLCAAAETLFRGKSALRNIDGGEDL